MKKHYTIIDFFEKEFYTQHLAWLSVSDNLPGDLISLVIDHLNPKPGIKVPFPKKVVWVGNTIINSFYLRTYNCRFVVWYDVFSPNSNPETSHKEVGIGNFPLDISSYNANSPFEVYPVMYGLDDKPGYINLNELKDC